MIDLTGRTALVTAAGQGIGHASVLALARAGATVVATDINSDSLADFEDVRGIAARRLDVLDPAAISALVGEVGRIDILFNCAGVVHSGSVLDCTNEEFEFAFSLNVKAQIDMIKAALPGMLERRDGCIINMASVASSVKGVPNRCLYSASKAAVIGLTKSVAADYVAQGIRCNAICPGTVDSPSLHDRLRAQGDYEAARRAFIARQPIGRIGKAEEIADLVVYLSGASYTTGAIHLIDGGWAI
jgi:2-keto-3-deoxy-L-fuconate dehydrogenase